MLKAGQVKEIHEMQGAGRSIGGLFGPEIPAVWPAQTGVGMRWRAAQTPDSRPLR